MIAKEVVDQLIKRQITITAAESLTAGQFQSTLAQVPGVSQVFAGGFVTYANQVKEELLQIPTDIIAENGVVSEPTAIWMASQAKTILHKDLGISFTGVAGPDELEGNPAGTVWIGLAYGDSYAKAHKYTFSGDRNSVRDQCVVTGLDLIRELLK